MNIRKPVEANYPLLRAFSYFSDNKITELTYHVLIETSMAPTDSYGLYKLFIWLSIADDQLIAISSSR